MVVGIACARKLILDSLYIVFGIGNHFRYMALHKIASMLGPEKSTALPLFHALTGYDTVSSFSSRGKNMDRLSSCNITHSLLQLSLDPNSVSQPQVFSVIERFVVLMYDRTSDTDYVNISESSCSLTRVGHWRQFLNVTPLCNTLNELAIKLC